MASGTERRPWTREEILLALHLYWRIPFGQQHSRNPEVVALAQALRRTPSSVAMKLNNLTSVDPDEAGRVRGLVGASRLDRETLFWWRNGRERAAAEAETLWDQRVRSDHPMEDKLVVREPTRPFAGPMEAEATQRVRRAQGYFRRLVLANFDGRCALTGILEPGLVIASHIVGWAEDPTQRLNPGNGLALNRLHDGAFDERLITFDEKLRLVVGKGLRDRLTREELGRGFLAYEGQKLRETERYAIDARLMERHRQQFVG